MKNMNLSERVKEIRMKSGLSQEVLADETGLSLRTIQRIESGQTEPRGDTLKKLANTLKVTPDEIIDWEEQTDKSFLSALNASSLGFILFPLLGIVIPLFLWIFKKGKIAGLKNLIREILNFQITWTLLLVLAFVTFTGITIYRFTKAQDMSPALMINPTIKYVVYGFLYAYNFILVIINSIRIKEEKEARYQPKIRFIR
ncbi:helix-turn-helix domain-containing protein [Prolixibacter bellariivorans]|nr:helix-turn-helix domain-containing protein [Prolixibacter bellariivorans]